MTNPIFKLEQEILETWNIINDIEIVTEWFINNSSFSNDEYSLFYDNLMNKYFAIKEIYDIRFENLFKTFEEVCKEYHTTKQQQDKDLTETFNEMLNSMRLK